MEALNSQATPDNIFVRDLNLVVTETVDDLVAVSKGLLYWHEWDSLSVIWWAANDRDMLVNALTLFKTFVDR